MTLSKTLATILGSAAALAILPAMADTSADSTVKTIDLSTAGYDLNDPADAKLVYDEIRSAAKRVCRASYGRETLKLRAERQKCMADAITGAVEQTRSTQLKLVMSQHINAS